ncbi:MAG: PaaI family thioesterase [Hyphomicrobiales bacterium]|nr:PaaI family thioesterase [Hyphomicrobiales bacterium]
MTHLGAQIDNIKAGQVEIQVPFSKHLSQQHGYFHGGLIGTIGDNAGGYSAFSLMAASDSVLTVEYKLNIMTPAKGELLVARGRVLRPGRILSVCQSDIFVSRNGIEKLCATMLGTFMTMAEAPDGPGDNN